MPCSGAGSRASRLAKRLGPGAPVSAPAVYLIDRPGAQQSLIVAGDLAPPKSDPRDVALDAFNQLLGGSFSGRINMNLREAKHWSYGAYSALIDARGERPFIVYAPVQTDRTAQAMQEIQREIKAALGPRPPTADELASTQDQATLTLPGRWETAASVAQDVAEQVRFGLPDDYWTTYAARVRALDLTQVKTAGRRARRAAAAGLARGRGSRGDRAGDPRPRARRAAGAEAGRQRRGPERSDGAQTLDGGSRSHEPERP